MALLSPRLSKHPPTLSPSGLVYVTNCNQRQGAVFLTSSSGLSDKEALFGFDPAQELAELLENPEINAVWPSFS